MARDRPSPYDERGAFCRSGPGRRAARLHRDQEVSPNGKTLIYETPSINSDEGLCIVASLGEGPAIMRGMHALERRYFVFGCCREKRVASPGRVAIVSSK